MERFSFMHTVITHFQPIVSVVKKAIVGLEGLSRGMTEPGGEIIPPDRLFRMAAEAGRTLELDRLCRQTALEAFRKVYETHSDILLFLNIEASVLEKATGSGHLARTVSEIGLPPSRIVIEINETKVHDTRCIKQFIDTYRSQGFLIALDDVGAGFSNLDRVALVQPDIIKIDRSLITGIDSLYHKQEVFKSLANLSRKIGALVVAEGVETGAEALTLLELGADMLQGYYFARPAAYSEEDLQSCTAKLKQAATSYKRYMTCKIEEEKQMYSQFDRVMESMADELAKESGDRFDAKLFHLVEQFDILECAYILDASGIQISDTVCRREPGVNQSPIYHPACKGEDHSLKKYYSSLVYAGLNKYLTGTYISLATGSLCVTNSVMFKDIEGTDFILCADFTPRL